MDDLNYSLALVGAGVRLPDMLTCGRFYKETSDWDLVRKAVVEDNILSLNKESTARRIAPELIKRLRTLSSEELNLFLECFGDNQCAFIWLMCCRSYQIMREFSEEVLVKRYSDMLPDIPENAYWVFAEEQEYEHEKYKVASDQTKKKIKSTIYTIMRDCKLITRDNQITPLYPSDRFVNLVRSEHPEDLNVFPKAGALL